MGALSTTPASRWVGAKPSLRRSCVPLCRIVRCYFKTQTRSSCPTWALGSRRLRRHPRQDVVAVTRAVWADATVTQNSVSVVLRSLEITTDSLQERMIRCVCCDTSLPVWSHTRCLQDRQRYHSCTGAQSNALRAPQTAGSTVRRGPCVAVLALERLSSGTDGEHVFRSVSRLLSTDRCQRPELTLLFDAACCTSPLVSLVPCERPCPPARSQGVAESDSKDRTANTTPRTDDMAVELATISTIGDKSDRSSALVPRQLSALNSRRVGLWVCDGNKAAWQRVR